MDEERLEGPRDRTFSRLRSVVGDARRLTMGRLLDLHRLMVGRREPSRDVRPANGDSIPDRFFLG